jgi:catechol 2,3-dioxygenase-like lactoylglutathione lyase family enzyme
MSDKMRFEGLTLTVESVERSIEFYSGKLGVKVEWNAVPAFAMLRARTRDRTPRHGSPRRSAPRSWPPTS